MKKLNLVGFMMLALMVGACQSEMDKELAEKEAQLKSEVGVSMLIDETRVPNSIKPLIGPGSKVGLIVKCQSEVRGPLAYTLNSSMSGLVETLPIINPTSEHTVCAYAPFDANTSNDPKNIQVTPVKAVQTQYGNGDQSALKPAFYVSPVNTYYIGEKPTIQFMHCFTNFHFNINTNIPGLVVKSIELLAPNGKLINFTTGYVDITRKSPSIDPLFGELHGLSGTSKTVLNIQNGGLSVPNSTTEYATAFMNVAPFKCEGEKLTVIVKTADNKTYTFSVDGQNYNKATAYDIPIRIEKEVKPVIKDIRVLSLCEVGSLGIKDNTKQWNCYYGALNSHAKEIRRMLFEYFGKGKLVETGVISFDKTDIKCFLNKMSDCDLDKYNIIYLNNNARPTAATSRRIMNWLNRSQDRVLMLAYDWKDPCVTPSTKEAFVICKTTTNYMMFKNEITGVKPHWYNTICKNYNIGNWGAPRSRMLVPFELNDRTKYFWKEGPFKTDLTASSDQRYWVEDRWWGSAVVTDPNVIPLISYRDARNDCYHYKTHKYGCGDGGMILGVDPSKRIVYIGDSEIFSTVCVGAKQRDARMAITSGSKATLNNYSKIMGNLWAWMINEVIQKPE